VSFRPCSFRSSCDRAGKVPAMTTVPTTYCDLKTLAAHLGISTRTIRNWVYADPPLPAYQPGGKLLFKLTEVDNWLEQHRVNPNASDSNGIMESVLKTLDAKNKKESIHGKREAHHTCKKAQ
jgi:excisionase family DNA binding protein